MAVTMRITVLSIEKPTRCTIFEFIEYHSMCFGRSFRPSSGVQDCTHSISYMSYKLVDCLLAGTRCTIFEFIEYHSTCFGLSFSPSSGVQDCTLSIRYMPYKLVDCMLAGTSWNGVPSRAR